MMHVFLANNRADLMARCKAKVARRPHRAASDGQLQNGIPIFLEQLRRTLEAEESNDGNGSLEISGAAGGDASNLSEIGVSATAHGKQLLELGYTVDQVVHDYGDLCQAITDLAVERDAPFGVDEFRTLNRCLDNATADAVTEFSFQRDVTVARRQEYQLEQRIGFLAHEVRNSLLSANLALHALEAGGLPITGATGSVLKRALAAMTRLINAAVEEVRGKAAGDMTREVFAVEGFLAEAAWSARLYAEVTGATLSVAPVDPAIDVQADRERILAALANLLQNAFKFTKPGTEVTLSAAAYGGVVNIEVSDHCGGLPHGSIERMFSPFTQRHSDRSGLGLGLSIARQSVEADGGTLTARDIPRHGCTFVLTLPRYRGLRSEPAADAAG
ncbi:MAG TPA: HAMP domain-containing sensor histidine kinase [Ramlibacter sp.]|nr:HAMP domain-containing sensor histidine kinase [Ramlibacter sp.]